MIGRSVIALGVLRQSVLRQVFESLQARRRRDSAFKRLRAERFGPYVLKGTPKARIAARGGRLWEPMILGILPICLQTRMAAAFI